MLTLALFIITFIMLFFTPANERVKLILMFIFIAILVIWVVFTFGVDLSSDFKWVK